MVSTVTARPNYYEVLGLGPTASDHEIAQAFAKELSGPRPFGSLAEVTIAYETLRDPAKRKAYDSSLGLHPALKPAFSLAGRLEAAQLPDSKSAGLVGRMEAPRALRASPVARPQPRAQSRTAPSATALLRQPITPIRREPDPVAQPKPKEFPPPSSEDKPRPKPETNDAFSRFIAERTHDTSHASVNWALPAAAAGALLLAVGIGAWTGWAAGNDSESVTVKVPSPKAQPRTVDPVTAEAAPDTTVAAAAPRTSPAATTARAKPPRPPLQIALPEEQQAEVAQLEQKQRELEEQAAMESPAVATAAKMPLPNAVVARTIGRIGYPCGQVASITAVEGGAPGTFNVTCTSGHSYRASPVHGRYHFRRLAGR